MIFIQNQGYPQWMGDSWGSEGRGAEILRKRKRSAEGKENWHPNKRPCIREEEVVTKGRPQLADDVWHMIAGFSQGREKQVLKLVSREIKEISEKQLSVRSFGSLRGLKEMTKNVPDTHAMDMFCSKSPEFGFSFGSEMDELEMLASCDWANSMRGKQIAEAQKIERFLSESKLKIKLRIPKHESAEFNREPLPAAALGLIHHLDLSECEITDSAAANLLEGLGRRDSKLEVLIVDSTKMKPWIKTALVQQIEAQVAAHTQLIDLDRPF